VNTKGVLLGVFVILTIVFASSTFIEHGQVTTSTTTSTTTQTSVSFGSWIYLSADGYATDAGRYVPSWGGDAYLFNCASSAATTQGCTGQVTSTLVPHPSYFVNVRYPYANQTEPSWANCLWTVEGIPAGQGYGYCTLINSTSFIVGDQAPPHL